MKRARGSMAAEAIARIAFAPCMRCKRLFLRVEFLLLLCMQTHVLPSSRFRMNM